MDSFHKNSYSMLDSRYSNRSTRNEPRANRNRKIPRTIHRPYFGLTLVEILIVVAILGILAAIVVPEYRGHTQKAKESAAKENLQILRTTIQRYALDNDGVSPGYPSNDPSSNPNNRTFMLQMIGAGKYMSEMPENPFSNKQAIRMIGNSDDFPTEPQLTDIFGWIYKPATKEIKLNWPGTDSEGTDYFDY